MQYTWQISHVNGCVIPCYSPVRMDNNKINYSLVTSSLPQKVSTYKMTIIKFVIGCCYDTQQQLHTNLALDIMAGYILGISSILWSLSRGNISLELLQSTTRKVHT